MAVAVTYPGVYIEEVPSGVRTITSVGTSITAFVDFFREGPMNRAVEVFGMADFARNFGGLDTRSEASYAISQFFLNGGSSALVVRCAGGTPGTAETTIGQLAALGTGALVLQARSPGLWGNTLRATVDHRTASPDTHFNLTIARHGGSASNAPVLAQESFLNVTLSPAGPRFVVDVIAADSTLVSAALHPDVAGIIAPNGTTSDDLAALDTTDFDAMRGDSLNVAVGASGNFLATLGTWPDGAVSSLTQLASRLETAIRTAQATGGNPPTPPCLTGASVQVVSYPDGGGGFTRHLVVSAGRDPARALTDIVVISAGAGDDLAAPLGLLAAATLVDNVQQYTLAGGTDGDAPGATELVGAVADANDEGIFALRKADLFNLLCLPRAALLEATQMDQVVAQATAFCERSRAFFLLDIPPGTNTVTEMKDWLDTHASYRSRNSAVFFPRLQLADPLNGFRLRSVGCSGTMAGVFARTDSDRGVWKAPAGIEAVLRGLSGMDMKLTDAENGVLNPLGINCLRVFPIYGSVAWGARTLDGADQTGSEWKYTPIRRLALMLEESLFRGTKWVVFEPNDEPLWARIRLNVGAYMMGLFRQGAFQGASPKDAFYVKCDAETTTQADRNLGIVNIQVGFAPLKPAEFVVIKIQQIAGDL